MHFLPPRGRALPARARSVLAALVAVVLLALSGCGGDDPNDPDAPNPFADRAMAAEPPPLLDSAVQQARADGRTEDADVLERLASTPTGIWLRPEEHPAGEVGTYVDQVVADAGDKLPVLVVYGIPDRDCTGDYSAGGLTPDTYPGWVGEIAAHAGGSPAVVVLEPDALPGAVECGLQDQRVELISGAVGSLADAGVTTYVDAGHSDWVPEDQIAPLLEKVGVDRVRGFATNVSNYQPQGQELAYARGLSSALDGAHYIVDTSRNGDPDGDGTPVTDWCNPPGQSLGQEPGYVDDDSGLDAVVWVKPPGESDGTCHGGPDAGTLWPERALELAHAAGW